MKVTVGHSDAKLHQEILDLYLILLCAKSAHGSRTLLVVCKVNVQIILLCCKREHCLSKLLKQMFWPEALSREKPCAVDCIVIVENVESVLAGAGRNEPVSSEDDNADKVP